MPRYDFDMFTIGAGSGGVASSRRAGAYGARVAICEELRVGGTCVLRGCVPKKLLVYGAQFADAFADAEGFGWTVPTVDFDWPKLIAAKDKEIGRLSQIYINMLNNAKVKIIDGRGVVVDPHTVEVNGKRYTAENILVAAGGWPETPVIPGIEHVISSNEALDLPTLPKRIVIVGGGYIAVEFAGIFNGFGSEVVELVRRPEVLRGFDEDIRVYLGEEMRGRGIDIRGNTHVARIDKSGDGYTVTTTAGDRIDTDLVMYATGRTPNTKRLGLAELGVGVTAPSSSSWSMPRATVSSVATCSGRMRPRSSRGWRSRSNAVRPSGSSTRPSASTRAPPRNSSRCATNTSGRRRRPRRSKAWFVGTMTLRSEQFVRTFADDLGCYICLM